MKLKTRLTNTPSFWSKKGIISTILLPLSWLYRGLQKLDRRSKEKKAYRPSIPVISVGNLTTGGTGKTPVVTLLAEHFTKKGETVAILSRGYGGTHAEAHLVTTSDTPKDVGDEPKMLFNMRVAAQVWVGHDRRESAKKAEAMGATLIILDDGFQHYKLKRDMDIVVIDGNYVFGNERLLPAGPLREPREEISRADLAVITNKPLKTALGIPHVQVNKIGKGEDIAPLVDKKLFAFCGIGLPLQFVKMLEKEGLTIVGTQFFPDHHPYTEEDMYEVMRNAQDKGAQVVTTAKDYIRIPKKFQKLCRVVNLTFPGAQRRQLTAAAEKAVEKVSNNKQSA